MSQIGTESPAQPMTPSTQNNEKTLIYSRDFLVQFQDNFKVDTGIVEKMKQFISPAQENRKIKVVDSNTPKQRLQFNENCSPLSTRTALGKYAKNTGVSRTPKPVKSTVPLTTKKNVPATTLKPNKTKMMGSPMISVTSSAEPQRRPLGLIATNIANNNQVSPHVSSGPEWIKKKTESTAKKTTVQNALNQIYYPKQQHAQPSTPVFLPSYQMMSPPIVEAASPMHSPFKPSPPKADINLPQSATKKQLVVTPATNKLRSITPTPVKTPASVSSATPKRKLPSPLDTHRVSQRQKQIDYGYKTVGYLRYRLLVPKEHRAPDHPRTPRKEQGCSKRSWDGQLKKWRRELHRWDPEDISAFQALLESDVVKGIINRSADLSFIIEDIKKKIAEGNLDIDNDYGGCDDSPADQENSGSNMEMSEDKLQTTNSTPMVAPPANIQDLVTEITNFENVARTLVF